MHIKKEIISLPSILELIQNSKFLPPFAFSSRKNYLQTKKVGLLCQKQERAENPMMSGVEFSRAISSFSIYLNKEISTFSWKSCFV